MTIGLGIVLFVVGAVLAFAVNVSLDWIEVSTVGWILMGAGVVAVLIGLVFLLRRRGSVSTERTMIDPGAGESVTRRESSTDL